MRPLRLPLQAVQRPRLAGLDTPFCPPALAATEVAAIEVAVRVLYLIVPL